MTFWHLKKKSIVWNLYMNMGCIGQCTGFPLSPHRIFCTMRAFRIFSNYIRQEVNVIVCPQLVSENTSSNHSEHCAIVSSLLFIANLSTTLIKNILLDCSRPSGKYTRTPCARAKHHLHILIMAYRLSSHLSFLFLSNMLLPFVCP